MRRDRRAHTTDSCLLFCILFICCFNFAFAFTFTFTSTQPLHSIVHCCLFDYALYYFRFNVIIRGNTTQLGLYAVDLGSWRIASARPIPLAQSSQEGRSARAPQILGSPPLVLFPHPSAPCVPPSPKRHQLLFNFLPLSSHISQWLQSRPNITTWCGTQPSSQNTRLVRQWISDLIPHECAA